jgi:hypothetical protein
MLSALTGLSILTILLIVGLFVFILRVKQELEQSIEIWRKKLEDEAYQSFLELKQEIKKK